MIHPSSDEHLEAIGLCGPRALLLTRYRQVYAVDYERLLHDSNVLGIELGLVNGSMEHSDIEKLVSHPHWNMTRIIILSVAGTKTFEARGPNWRWPEEQPLTEPDVHTICIMYDPVEKHYWAVAAITTLVFKGRGGAFQKGVSRFDCYRCFYCCFGEDRFVKHNCTVNGLHHCRICKTAFSYAGWERHNTLHRTDLNCECCGQTQFNGQDCFDKHMIHNCTPPTSFSKAKCNVCHRQFREGKELEHKHVFPDCRHCGEKFDADGYQLYKSHRCYLGRADKFWRAADETEEPTWSSHWFYDFETCRGPVVGTRQYQHEVMAWCTQLMVPDGAAEEMIRKNEWIEAVMLGLETTVKPIYSDITYESVRDPMGDTIRIMGKSLDSFVQVVEQVLKSSKWTPTLWAHNGSKFDVKFVLDHYLNQLGYELGGDIYEEEETGFKKTQNAKRRQVCSISSVGSKVLQLKVNDITFRCSHAHMSMELRRMPSVFGLDELLVKGEFPYGRMSQDAWGTSTSGLPSLSEFEPDSKVTARRYEIIDWWSKEQQRRNYPKHLLLMQLANMSKIEPILAQAYLYEHDSNKEVEEWDFTTELWKYLYADVNVGARCMEKYHQTSIDMHKPIWQMQPQKDGMLVSPLQYPTAPGWANAMFRTWFVPENICAILRPPEATFIRDSLHGGRTDKRANMIQLTPERRALGDRIVYVDFKSLYPSVQDSRIHDTYFPVGPPKWIKTEPGITDFSGTVPYQGGVDNDIMLKMMENKTGFVSVATKVKKYVTHPTLSRLGSNDPSDKSLKLLFENKDVHRETFAWPELEEAIRCGEIDVTMLYEGLLFDKGTDVFEGYVQFFFKMKQDAEDRGNKGLRELAKLLLNSLWGKLGQRSYPCREWVQDAARLDFLIKEIEAGRYELCRIENRETHRIWIQYRIVRDLNNLSNTNYQLAAFVSMWGRVMLHKKVLAVHGQRVLYCDTDSGIIYLREGDAIPFMGDKIGDLTDEVPGMVKGKGFVNPYIDEAVFIAPKTYALQIRCSEDASKIYQKVVCKGFESSYAGSANLNFQSMKELVNDKFKITRRLDPDGMEMPPRKRIEGVPRLQFRSSMANNTITPVETSITKNIEGEYTKGRVHPTDKRLIVPFGEWEPTGSFLDFEKVDGKYIDYE